MRGEGRQPHTEAGLGHNGPPPPGISEAEFLQFVEEFDAADQKVAEAVSEKKGLRTRLKGKGIDLAGFDLHRKLAQLPGERRDALFRALLWFMRCRRKPLPLTYHQLDMFEPEPEAETGNGLDPNPLTDAQIHKISNDGFAAGQAGRDRQKSNTWSLGSYSHQVFNNAWMRGQEALAQTLAPPEPKRPPGRPKGSRDRKPRVRGGEAEE